MAPVNTTSCLVGNNIAREIHTFLFLLLMNRYDYSFPWLETGYWSAVKFLNQTDSLSDRNEVSENFTATL